MTPKQSWKMVVENRGLIGKVIEKKFNWIYQNPGILSFDDYYAAGLFGLYSAARKYDPALAKFSTYAFKWIYQAISRVYRTEGFKSVRVPCYAYDRISKLKQKHKEEFETFVHNGCSPTVKAMHHALQSTLHLNAPIDKEGTQSEKTWGDVLLPTYDNGAIGLFDGEDKAGAVASALDCLNEREKRIVSARYGINTQPCSLKMVASRFRISKQRASQIEKKALIKIRKHFARKKITKGDVI